MMLQRFLFTLSLIISFGFGQMGALTHEISHYSDIVSQHTASQNQQQSFNKTSNQDTSQSSKNDLTPHNQVCEKCVSYAQIGHLIHSADVVLPTATSQYLLVSFNAQSASFSKPRTYAARAPPHNT